MDALVAYLQVLGRLTDAAYKKTAAPKKSARSARLTEQVEDCIMDLDHDTLVAFSKSWGLFYLIAFAIGVCVYTFWPSNRKRFDEAKKKHPRSGRQAMAVEERDPVSGHVTTGHEWNGIKGTGYAGSAWRPDIPDRDAPFRGDLVVRRCRPGPWERLTPKACSASISARRSRKSSSRRRPARAPWMSAIEKSSYDEILANEV